MPGSTLLKIEGLHQFENAHRRASWLLWWHRLARRRQTLIPFDAIRPLLAQRSALDRGIAEIPIASIVGSAGRAMDFDPVFRPLRTTLRHRWVAVRRLLQTVGWEPIIVYKVGDIYFVEDGHHRVSVARNSGLSLIEARVYEFPVTTAIGPRDSLATILKKLRATHHPAPLTSVAACACV